MRMLKHVDGFIMIDKIGSVTIVEPYGRRQRCFVKVDGENIALWADDPDTMYDRVRELSRILTTENKGSNLIVWEDLA